MPVWELEAFKKEDKEDGDHCVACQTKMVQYGTHLPHWKAAETAATDLVAELKDGRDRKLLERLAINTEVCVDSSPCGERNKRCQ